LFCTLSELLRDEATPLPRVYYYKFPQRLPSSVVILGLMLATGGSACLAVQTLVDGGYRLEDICFTGVIAVREGIDRLSQLIPQGNNTVAAVDPRPIEQKFIVPGLADYVTAIMELNLSCRIHLPRDSRDYRLTRTIRR
jgi:uracil phosphoribosyltransferase